MIEPSGILSNLQPRFGFAIGAFSRNVSVAAPFRPFWMSPGVSALHRSPSISSAGFFTQHLFTDTLNYADPDSCAYAITSSPLAGEAVFARLDASRRVGYHKSTSSVPSVEEAGWTRVMQFNAGSNSVIIAHIPDTGNAFGSALGSPGRTSPTQRNIPYRETEFTVCDISSSTMSEEVTTATLASGLAGIINDFSITGGGSVARAFRTTSTGINGAVGMSRYFGAVRWNTPTTPSVNGVGSSIAQWNGNFQLREKIVTRKLPPVAYSVASGWSSVGVADDIYRAGTYRMEMLDEVTDLRRDNIGVFAPTLAEAFEGAPLIASESWGRWWNRTPYTLPEQARFAKATFISRDGRRYRITMQTGRYGDYEYDEEAEEWVGGAWEPQQTAVVTMAPATLRAEWGGFGMPESAGGGMAEDALYTLLEVWDPAASTWSVVASLAEGELAVAELIGGDVESPYLKVLAIGQQRDGQPFGFFGLLDGETRFAGIRRTMDRTSHIPGVSGTLRFVEERHHDPVTGLWDGKLQLLEAEADLGGDDWRDLTEFPAIPSDAATVSNSLREFVYATPAPSGEVVIRHDYNGTLIAAPGKVLEVAYSEKPVRGSQVVVGGLAYNAPVEATLAVPPAGTQVAVEEFRVTY